AARDGPYRDGARVGSPEAFEAKRGLVGARVPRERLSAGSVIELPRAPRMESGNGSEAGFGPPRDFHDGRNDFLFLDGRPPEGARRLRRDEASVDEWAIHPFVAA